MLIQLSIYKKKKWIKLLVLLENEKMKNKNYISELLLLQFQ